MTDLFRTDTIFWFCAMAGTGLFVIQLMLTLLGGDHSHEVDEGGFDTVKFKWLSKQALTGFLMMFGWAGLTCRKEFALSNATAALIGSGAGLICMFLTAVIFNASKKLRSPGNVFRIEELIGKEATIYQRIPKDGTGKITVSLHELTHEIDAISHNREELASFTQVQIIKKADEKTVVVVPAK